MTTHRIGQGYDIHRLQPDNSLIIAGILVDSPLGTIAHSDGDVLYHALIDALLGALGRGDIGDHFPPSDPQYKNVASAKLLTQVLTWVHQAELTVVNVDSTIFLEKPKLARYKDTFRHQIATALGIEMDCVNVKAKTAEKLGAIGHSEAIAASVTVLLVC